VKLPSRIPSLAQILLLAGIAGITPRLPAEEPAPANKILFIYGPTKHPPGTHEVAAGARLLKYCVDESIEHGAFQTEICEGWPTSPSTLSNVRLVVFTGDQFPPYILKDSDTIFRQLSEMVDRGCSIVCIHYATSVNDTKSQKVPPAVQSYLYRCIGGFGLFLPDNAEPGTQAHIMQATMIPAKVDHPVLRGVVSFSLRDEPYYPIRFDPKASGAVVTPLMTAMIPPDLPSRQVVSWCIDRGGGSRGFAVVMPHFFVNWQIDDLRKLVLNGIFWAAGAEIPAKGIDARLPPLEAFRPMAVQFTPPAKDLIHP
jgi:type 1 glutamine amidotransferase